MPTILYHKIDQPEALAKLRASDMIALDKDGVFVDDSRVLHENRRRGFEASRIEFRLGVETSYRMGGIGEEFNGGIAPILAILAFKRMLESEGGVGITEDEAMKRLLGREDAADILRGLISDRTTEEDKTLARQIYWWDGGAFFNSQEAANYVSPVPGAREAFLGLRDIYRGNAAIVTNAYSVDLVVRDMRLCGFSDKEITSTVLVEKAGKPSPEGVWKAHASLQDRSAANISRDKIIFVGDTVIDMVTARNANSVAVGVLTGMGTLENLASGGADIIVKSMPELFSILRE